MKNFLSCFILLLLASSVWSQSNELEVSGSVTVGNAQEGFPVGGTIRWNGLDLQAYNGIEWISLIDNQTGPVTDIDGNRYPTATIGDQTWMAANLRTAHYRDGQLIPNVGMANLWTTLSTGAYCWYNLSSSHDEPYGKLYNWFAVNNVQGVCPEGWEVPTLEDWATLADALGGELVAGGALKEAGTEHWNDPNLGATNSSGFSAVPGSSRSATNGNFGSLGSFGFYWTRSELESDNTRGRYIWFQHNSAKITLGGATDKQAGMAIRCVKE